MTEAEPLEPFLGLFDPSVPRLALLPLALVPGEAREVSARRVGGLPSALVPVADGVSLDVSGLVRGWATWASALERTLGREALDRLVAAPPIFAGPHGKSLKDRILEHQIRAENLVLVDVPLERRAAAAELKWTFPSGVLEVHVPGVAYAPFTVPKGARALWKGEEVALLPEVPWTDADLVALTATMATEPPATAAMRVGVALPDGGEALPPSEALGGALFVAGYQTARSGAPKEGLVLLERARTMVVEGTKLSGAVLHELALAKLKTTASRLHGPHVEYSFKAEHRATWSECLALFEEAARLDPSLPAADEAARLTTMIALLDQQSTPPTPGSASAARRRPKPAPKSEDDTPTREDDTPALSVWLPPAIIAALLALFFGYVVYTYLL